MNAKQTKPTRSKSRGLLSIYERLHAAYGPQHWWPARTAEEVVIGAILTQNTAWTNVERAIARLREARTLTLRAIDQTPLDRLSELVRPAGTYRVKALRLKALTAWLRAEYGGRLDRLFEQPVEEARVALLSVPGVGPETADAILLYAGEMPTFVVDAYTRRILRRHFLIPPDADYDRTKVAFENALGSDAKLFNEYHALLVELGKRHCRTKARCAGCPLEDLPHDPEL